MNTNSRTGNVSKWNCSVQKILAIPTRVHHLTRATILQLSLWCLLVANFLCHSPQRHKLCSGIQFDGYTVNSVNEPSLKRKLVFYLDKARKKVRSYTASKESSLDRSGDDIDMMNKNKIKNEFVAEATGTKVSRIDFLAKRDETEPSGLEPTSHSKPARNTARSAGLNTFSRWPL